jgi:hypothetical protein
LQASHNLAGSRRVSSTWYLLATALVALGALTLLALQRGALGGLGAAPSWAWPSIATGTAIGGVALGWLALTRFAREAEQQPYVWTAPLLVIFCFAPLSQLAVSLPMPGIPLWAFLSGAGALIVSGGAFGRVASFGARLLGATLTLTPTLLLVLGYVLQSGAPRGALAHVEGPGLWLLGMTLFAGLGVSAIAIVAQALEQASAHGRANLAAADAGRLAELVHHAQGQWQACQTELARLAEERQLFEAWLYDQRTQLAQQLQRASLAPQLAAAPAARHVPDPTEPRLKPRAARPPSDDTREFMAMARPGLGWPTKLALVALTVGGLAAGAYFGWYQPRLARQHAEARLAREAAAAQAADVAALRDKLAAEQARAEQALADEHARAEAARLAAERSAAESARQQAELAATEAAAAAEAAEAKATKQARVSATRRAKKRAGKTVARGGAATAGEDDPIAGLDGI